MIEEGVRQIGDVRIGIGVSISAPAELMAKDSHITIGDGCDIASFVVITTADSHLRVLELASEVKRKPIIIGAHVFIGAGAIILGGSEIGAWSVIGAGVVIAGLHIEPYSRVRAPHPYIEPGYYARERKAKG